MRVSGTKSNGRSKYDQKRPAATAADLFFIDRGTVDVAPPEIVAIWDDETRPGFGKLLSFLLRFFGFVFWLLLIVPGDDEFIRWEDRVFPYIVE